VADTRCVKPLDRQSALLVLSEAGGATIGQVNVALGRDMRETCEQLREDGAVKLHGDGALRLTPAGSLELARALHG
jgi:hypothetical protein